jgi:hypothetical protein
MRKKSITSRHTPNGCSATWFLWSNIFVRSNAHFELLHAKHLENAFPIYQIKLVASP